MSLNNIETNNSILEADKLIITYMDKIFKDLEKLLVDNYPNFLKFTDEIISKFSNWNNIDIEDNDLKVYLYYRFITEIKLTNNMSTDIYNKISSINLNNCNLLSIIYICCY